MKLFFVCTILVVSALAEPPVDNRYLPPQALSATPSQTYGTPSFNNQRQTGALVRGQPSSNYNAPSRRGQSVSNQYIPPQSQQYQAPGNLNLGSINQYQAPSTQYGLPNQAQSGNRYTAPSQEYGTPGFGRGGSQDSLGGNDYSQSRQYLPPGQGYDDGSNGEPANYNFQYMVLDQYSGNDFGHRESRQGDRAAGLYYVLLPDGRKQTVEYEADQDGYKPRISYEDTGAGAGYDKNSQGYSNQYENGPY